MNTTRRLAAVGLPTALLFLATALASSVLAQDALLAPRPGEVLVGPINVTQDLGGVTLTARVSSFIAVTTDNDQFTLVLRLVSDLADLQNKIGPIVDMAPLPKNNCDHFGIDNLVASIWGKRLLISGNTATLELKGDVDN